MSRDFVKLERLLSGLITSVSGVFSQEEIEEVQSLIDVGEYGVALETFVDVVVEENKGITKSCLVLIEEAAAMMEMDPEVFSRKLIEHFVD